MHKVLCLVMVIVNCVVMAGPIPGLKATSFVMPYTSAVTLIGGSGVWTATFNIFEIRTKDAGSISIKLSDDGGYTTVYTTSYDVVRVNVQKIDLTASTSDTIMVFGYPYN